MDERTPDLFRLVGALRAAGEPTRLRILALLLEGDLNVTEIVEILGQSQPGISRHLKLLVEAGLVERSSEGGFAFFQLANNTSCAGFLQGLDGSADPSDPLLAEDRRRLQAVRVRRSGEAAAYFRKHAERWDETRQLGIEEAEVEQAMRDLTSELTLDSVLDVGTGTGRVLELFAGRARRAVGIDLSLEMLRVARSNLSGAGIAHARLRHGDACSLPLLEDSFDLVVIHQVLHFLDDPRRAIAEAARVVRPGGHVLVVDLAPHQRAALRTEHAHRRLGIATETLNAWGATAGLASIAVRELDAPKPGESELSVSLWLARREPESRAETPYVEVA